MTYPHFAPNTFNYKFNVMFLNRGKTISLEKMRMRLLHDLESYEGEEKCLSEYRRELELLQQEKMAHVEELRQIHSDINAVCTRSSYIIHIHGFKYSIMNN